MIDGWQCAMTNDNIMILRYRMPMCKKGIMVVTDGMCSCSYTTSASSCMVMNGEEGILIVFFHKVSFRLLLGV